ncbi:Putative ankyrin repeat protein R578 [Frankliniella fusca]|uniref:Ankyrin repeat protein R578 n=1 Tax=Frankliniella fusca TaxID=407009 RepID=A0AAE1LRD1_9NEOP|nr:Putative ankyrin repeat protein R578 [Frankliniella fusca]
MTNINQMGSEILMTEPKQYEIGVGADGKRQLYHYVPIGASLKALLNDPAIDSALLTTNDNPDSIKLILYQDEFEVVCAIGPAKKKYKMLAVYYALGNLPPHLRSSIKNIQLALCRKKYFNPEIVFKKIVADLKVLETVGFELKPNVYKKACIVNIAGDNLGSHSLGGFVENFSSSKFFCRYCLIQRKDLNNFELIECGSEDENPNEEEVDDVLSDSVYDIEAQEQEVD